MKTAARTPRSTGSKAKHEASNEPNDSKQSTTALDIASLISLSLSDYNIWLDADLRWKIDACLNDAASPDEPGCTSSSIPRLHFQETSRLINDDLHSRTYQLPPPPYSVSRFTPTASQSARPIRNGGGGGYSPYPFGRLVFVRNIHPDTNKTTLKSLFAQAFQDGSSLDYVDFSRGMDTVRVRLYITYFFFTVQDTETCLFSFYASVIFVSRHRTM